MRRWECTKDFVLTKGALNREAESHLTKQSVRFIGIGPDGQQAYSYFTFVEAELVSEVIDKSRLMLEAIMAPYPVEWMVYNSSARVVRADRESR